ncbi:permease prefix domain 1-containing protein [Breznakia pachnodae]|uniref:ABC-type multidrug transport system fused ATPase/permease subunit n=1 Tax=Breznakia pachnodae TaxID=265178 RepID=A0ABU0E1Q3_9FIRM|nr:permease prefix domain 1-containing protein [Breznakia pachnodae]MDQ0360746.1 ABC-type multidrug transport system fused ATPase/permease subunit [Breznakia pachnodae]
METIRAYIEQMFRDLPKTKEVVEMKLNIQDHMEDKFQELVNSGMNEASASREVINEFGDMSEILKELNIDPEASKNGEEVNYLRDEEVDEYIRWKNYSGTMIAVAVLICINAVGVSQFVGTIIWGKLGNILTGVVFFGMVAAAVLIFIYFGTKSDAYKYIEEDPSISPQKMDELRRGYADYKARSGILIGVGVVLCIVAVGLFTLVEWILGDAFAILVFFAIVSAGVFMFIKTGTEAEGYELFVKGKTASKKAQQDSPLYGIIMLSATGIFLLLGFLGHLWHPGWVVFPIGGILCGIVAVATGRE